MNPSVRILTDKIDHLMTIRCNVRLSACNNLNEMYIYTYMISKKKKCMQNIYIIYDF